MSHEKDYIDTLRSLVNSLKTANEPDAWRIYAIIRALVYEIQSELNVGERVEDREANARLDAIIAECHAAVFGSDKAAIERAVIQLTALENSSIDSLR